MSNRTGKSPVRRGKAASSTPSRSASWLLPITEVPSWVRFNRFVLTGYRPQMNVLRTASTFARWHNESVNVWTHVLPALWYVYLLWNPPVDLWTMQWTLLSFIFIFSASTMYHLFIPCCCSQDGYTRLITCDVLGALACITMSGYSFIAFGYRCTSAAEVQFYSVLFGLAASLVLLAIVSFRMTVVQRFKMFGLLCILRLILSQIILLPKVFGHGFSWSYTYHTLSFFMMLIGGLFNISRVPERWVSPHSSLRWVDYIGNSHNIWHLFCFASAHMTMLGAIHDGEEYASTVCPWEK
jgi:adiponectin receptor